MVALDGVQGACQLLGVMQDCPHGYGEGGIEGGSCEI